MSTSEPNSADTTSDDVDTEPQNTPAGEILTPENPDKPGDDEPGPDEPGPDEPGAPAEAHPA